MKLGDIVKTKLLENDPGVVVKVLGKKWFKVQIGNMIFLEHIDDLNLVNKKHKNNLTTI